MQPLKFNPVLKEILWGGDALGRLLNKPVSPGAKIGESWELSQHKNGESVVSEGEWAGKTLTQVISENPRAILGKWMARKYGQIPLLIKFIDAQDRLSLQVHPDDEDAKLHGYDFGKTEAWYVVQAKPDATLICGLNREMNKEEVRTSLTNSNFETRLNEFDVKAGDCVFVPAGTVHSIQAGLLIYEVQEVSDVTYRLYDWRRKDASGNPRELHLEESLRVMNLTDTADHATRPIFFSGEGFEGSVLVGCAYFVLEKYRITGTVERPLPDRFEVVTVLEGEGTVVYDDKEYPIRCGETHLIPAQAGSYRIKGQSQAVSCLVTWVPRNKSAARKELLARGMDKKGLKQLGGL